MADIKNAENYFCSFLTRKTNWFSVHKIDRKLKNCFQQFFMSDMLWANGFLYKGPNVMGNLFYLGNFLLRDFFYFENFLWGEFKALKAAFCSYFGDNLSQYQLNQVLTKFICISGDFSQNEGKGQGVLQMVYSTSAAIASYVLINHLYPFTLPPSQSKKS